MRGGVARPPTFTPRMAGAMPAHPSRATPTATQREGRWIGGNRGGQRPHPAYRISAMCYDSDRAGGDMPTAGGEAGES
jgi:hypothetical protein